MRVRFSWLFVCIFCLMLSQISLQGLVRKDGPKIGTRGQAEEKPSTTSTWKKGETPKTERKGSEIGTHRKSSDESEDDEEGAVEKEKSKKKKSTAKKVGKVLKEVSENPMVNKLVDFGLDQAGNAIKADQDRKNAEAQAKAEETKRKADLEYERQRLAIQREDEMERLKIEKARQDLELLEQKKAAAKKRLEEARKQAGEQEELTGESAEDFVPSVEEEARIEAAVPALSGYPKVLKEEFEEVLTNPDFVQNVDQFVNNLKIFVYINIGGKPESEDPQELKDAYSATQKFLDKLVKAIDAGKIKILKSKLSEIQRLKTKMSEIELTDFLTEAKEIIVNHKNNKFPIENQTLFLRGITEWACYVVALKKEGKLDPAVETQFVAILNDIPFGKEVTDEAIRQLQDVKKK